MSSIITVNLNSSEEIGLSCFTQLEKLAYFFRNNSSFSHTQISIALNDSLTSFKKRGLLTKNNFVQFFEQKNWDQLTCDFSNSKGAQYNFFAGLLKAKDQEPADYGFFLLKKNQIGTNIFNFVKKTITIAGKQLFGKSLKFNGREVEFYDLVYASDQYKKLACNKIALFIPFYLGGLSTDLSRNSSIRRTILFHNIVKLRYEHLTKPMLSNILMDGAPSQLLSASVDDINHAISLWLCLHELMHANGPIPLFGNSIHKKNLGLSYGYLEEARVDMTSYLTLDLLADKIGPLARLTQELILSERLGRSARQIVHHGYNTKNLDCEHGLLWLGLLLKENYLKLELKSNQMYILKKGVEEKIRNLLTLIYQQEETAINNVNNENGKNQLIIFAKQLKELLIEPYLSTIRAYFQNIPLPIDFNIDYI